MDYPQSIVAQVQQVEIIQGTVVEGGIACPLLRLADGRVLALQGVGRSEARPGAKLRLKGMHVQMSTCQQGPAFHVIELTKE